MVSRKVLLVFHLNFLKQDRGCCNYIYMMAKFLKESGYKIDFFCTSLFEKDEDELYKYNKLENNLIDNIYYIKHNDKLFPNSWCSKKICDEFNKIINKNEYDFINIHYIEWVNLIKYSQIPNKTEIIYTQHDNKFIQASYCKEKNIGNIFQYELQDMSVFDKITCISFDEMLLWSHMLPQKKFVFLPYTQNKVEHHLSHTKKYDLLFIGANNPYNVEGLIWFLDNIYPGLQKDIRIAICGKVLNEIQKKYPTEYDLMKKSNFELIDFCENLNELYENTKISIVPMLRGTGMKIKTIEAMAHGIPVISTLLGVDGFPDKYENGILVSDEPSDWIKFIENLHNNEIYYQKKKKQQNDYFNKIFDHDTIVKTIISIFTSTQKIKRLQTTIPFEEKKQKSMKIKFEIKLFNFIPIYSHTIKDTKIKCKVFGIPLIYMEVINEKN